MKKNLFTAALLLAAIVACQNDQSQLSPTKNLTVSDIGKLVSASEAFSQAASYQQADPAGIFAVAYSRTVIESVLNQPGAIGIRLYYVNDATGNRSLSLIGIDKNLNNISTLHQPNARDTDAGGLAASSGMPCPQHCTSTSRTSLPTDSVTIKNKGNLIGMGLMREQVNAYATRNPTGSRAIAFGRQVLTDVLTQKDCVGLRFYFTNTAETTRNLIFVGINDQSDDIRATAKSPGYVGGNGKPCAEDCAF